MTVRRPGPEASKETWEAYEQFVRALGHDPDHVAKVVIEKGAVIVDSVHVHPLDAK